MSLYDEGVNRKFLSKEVHYISWMKHSFPGISHVMKIFSPRFLYNHCVRGKYDIVISYLSKNLNFGRCSIFIAAIGINTKIYGIIYLDFASHNI